MTKDEALKLALEALEWEEAQTAYPSRMLTNAITAIKQALAAPVQEPVAGQPLPCPFCGHIGLDFSDGETYRWGVASCSGCGASCGEVRREYPDKSEWHTEAIAEWNRRSTAAQRPWFGLTDEEIKTIDETALTKNMAIAMTMATLKEKNK